MVPAMFLAHGSPMIAIEDSEYARFLDDLGGSLSPVKAAVVFSAHWESGVQSVSGVSRYTTIYDFGGFPDALYQVEYPAPGDPEIASRIQRLLQQAGIESQVDPTRGLDHGAWTLLKRLFPQAQVPIVEMSVNQELEPSEQYRVGQALSSLRQENILFIGSGVTVHNFSLLPYRDNSEVQARVRAFEDWLEVKLTQAELEAILHYREQAPDSELAVPSRASEHFAPLLYVMGAAGSLSQVQILHSSWMWNVMSNAVFAFH